MSELPSGLAGVLVSSTPMFVALSDRLGRRAVIMGGALFGLLFAFPLFWMLDTGDMFLVWLAFALGIAVCVNSTFAPQGAYFTELFDPRARYSGFIAAREMSGRRRPARVDGRRPVVDLRLPGPAVAHHPRSNVSGPGDASKVGRPTRECVGWTFF